MKNITYIKAFLLLCLTASLGFFSACDDEGEANSGQVSLLSFGPTGVKHGETISFIGQNLNKVTSIVLTPGIEIASGSFASQTSELIELVVPNEAESGKIILRTPDGDIESKTVLSFEVPVEITGITAAAKPGTTMTISGNFVNWIESVTFPEDVVVDEFVSKSLTEVVLTVPMEARSGALIISTGGTEPLLLETETELQVTLPAVTGLSPETIERGTELTITGTDLDLVKEVKFKGNVSVGEADFINRSSTEIVLIFPMEGNKGTIGLVAYSGVEVESEQALTVAGDLPPLAPLAAAVYTDGLQNGWQKWGGWGGGSADLENAENVRDGEKAIKAVFVAGWGGAMQFGGATMNTAGHTKFAISIYGEAGTNGKNVNLVLKNGAAATEIQITIVEGEWTEHEFDIAGDLGGIATITEMFLQDRDWAGTLYVDHIGLR